MPEMYRRFRVYVRSTAPPDPEDYQQKRDAIRAARRLADRHRGHPVEVVEEPTGWRASGSSSWLVYRAEWREWPKGYQGYGSGWTGNRRGEVLGRELLEKAPD